MPIFRRMLLLCLLLLGSAAFAQNEDISLPITEDTEYLVESGDTLDGLAVLFDISPTCLAQTNNVLPTDQLMIGMTLSLSVDCPRYGDNPLDRGVGFVVVPREVVTFEDDCAGYRVQAGDTLDGIGQELDVSVVALQLDNGIAVGSPLVPNECLDVAADAPAYGLFPALDGVSVGNLYTVSVGETLDDIAQSLDVQVEAIEAANNINAGRNALPGTEIVIPTDAPPYGSDEEYEPGTIAANRHVVQPGQTGDSIAQLYNISRACLAETNELTEPGSLSELGVGQTLVIDDSCPEYEGYNEPPTSAALRNDAASD